MDQFIDTVSLQRVAQLHPLLRLEAEHCLRSLWAKGVRARVTQGLRTMEQQRVLYAMGRTTPGKIVTKAKPGQSYHNYGLALDFCIMLPGGAASFNLQQDANADGSKDWDQVVAEFKAAGWSWGGDWATFKDTPHLEKTFGYSPKQLAAMLKLGETYPDIPLQQSPGA